MDVTVGLCALGVSIATALFGYFKLMRDTKMSAVTTEISLWKTRVEHLEQKCHELQMAIAALQLRYDECELARERLFREKLDLLSENRTLRAKQI